MDGGGGAVALARLRASIVEYSPRGSVIALAITLRRRGGRRQPAGTHFSLGGISPVSTRLPVPGRSSRGHPAAVRESTLVSMRSPFRAPRRWLGLLVPAAAGLAAASLLGVAPAAAAVPGAPAAAGRVPARLVLASLNT